MTMPRTPADEDEAPKLWFKTDDGQHKTDEGYGEPDGGGDVEWPKPIRRSAPDPTDKADGEGMGQGWKLAITAISALAFVGFFGEPIGKLAVQTIYGGDGLQPQ